MALTPEDGSGIEAADCYVVADQVAAYAIARGLAFIPDDSGNAAILRATTWLDGAYQARFPGVRAHGRQQGLQWPRKHASDAEGGAIAPDEIPKEIIAASCEAAIREALTPGALSPIVTPGKIMSAASVSGAVSVQYKSGGGVDGQRQVLTVIDDILAPLIGPRPGPASAIIGEASRA